MNPTDPAALAQRLAVLGVLAARIKQADTEARQQFLQAMAVGDRLNPADDDVKLAAVSKIRGRTGATITDPEKFARWCAEHYPTEVEHRPVVRDSWARAVLDASKRSGQPCAPDGTLDIPGVSVTTGDPTVTVRLTEDASEAVEALWRAGRINLGTGEIRALPEA